MPLFTQLNFSLASATSVSFLTIKNMPALSDLSSLSTLNLPGTDTQQQNIELADCPRITSLAPLAGLRGPAGTGINSFSTLTLSGVSLTSLDGARRFLPAVALRGLTLS